MEKKIHKPSLSGRFIFIWGILVVLLLQIHRDLNGEETGFKYFKNYDWNEDYKHQPQNWGVVQDPNGIIYVANSGGVLVYDGVSWRPLGIPEYAVVRSLAIDESGTVYIGGVGEIGCFKVDEKGSLQYMSLMDRLKKEQRKFLEVWRTVATEEGIYFSSNNFLFRWDPRRKIMKVWERDDANHPFIYPFTVDGQLYIHRKNVGLMQIIDDSLELIPGGERFTDAAGTIFMVVPYDTGNDTNTLLIGARHKGFFLYDGDKKTVSPFSTKVDDYLRGNRASHGINLSNGDFALATRDGGLVIMDPRGELKYIFDKSSGLQDVCVYYVFEDNQGNLWLCLNNGISKIEYASPFSIYDNRAGLPNMVLSVVRHDNDLYVGTMQGIYVLPGGSKTFGRRAGTRSCWDLISIDDSILAATSAGVFQVKKNSEEEIIKDLSFALLPSGRYPGLAWCGTKYGLAALIKKNNRWQEGHRFNDIKQEIRSIAEDPKGNVWLGTQKEGTLKVDFSVSLKQPGIKQYIHNHGLPEGRVTVSWAAGHVMFATDKGIFRFDEENEKFIPDQTLGDKFAGGLDSESVFRIVEDKDKTVWIHSRSRNYQAVPGPGGSYTIYANPFRRIPKAQGNAIYPDPDGKNTWFGSYQGLIRYDKTFKKNYRQNFQTLLRKVSANEKLILAGHKEKAGKKSKGLLPIFEHKDRNLYFEFAAPFFEAETETEYQYFLEGYDDGWSTWNKNVKRDYTNLDSKLYTFRVRSRNIYQHISSEDVFQFKVLPPWYKTWWAYFLYVIGFLLLMFLVVKWRSRILENDKQKLENTIKERTKEINDKNQQLEAQTVQLKDQSEKLKEMDQLKSRFFANISHEFRTPLTLIMSPLEQMIADTRDKEQKNKFKVMRRSSQRLLTLINQLLDLSRFDSEKMELQASRQDIIPFLKGTVASFHLAALENQLDLVFHTEEAEILLYFDPPKMEEVMYNVLINAIKFTPQGGKITVSVTVGKDRQD